MPAKISPLAKAMADFHKIDTTQIKGTGIQGRIMSSDLFNNQNQNANTPKQDTVMEVTTIRSAIAKAMTVSTSEIPATVLTFFVDVTNLVNYRKQVRDQVYSMFNLKLSFLPFIMKAVMYALREYPIFNSSYDKQQNKIILKSDINFGIAVDTPNGLMVPNIKKADELSIVEIGHKIVELAVKAREKRLSLAEIKNGTISITNFGSINAAWGTPIINFPEVAIVAPGGIEERLAVNENNQIIVKHMMPFTIAADHRWIDGADIGRFMKKIAHHLETLEGLQIK